MTCKVKHCLPTTLRNIAESQYVYGFDIFSLRSDFEFSTAMRIRAIERASTAAPVTRQSVFSQLLVLSAVACLSSSSI